MFINSFIHNRLHHFKAVYVSTKSVTVMSLWQKFTYRSAETMSTSKQ